MSTIKVDTVRPVTADASLTLQGDSGGSGVTGLTIDSSGNTALGGVLKLKSSGNSITASDGTTAVLSESSSVVTLTANNAVIEGSSSGDLVRITQTGSGNALVVEDETNPDSTPFVIDASGNVGIGLSSPGYTLEVQPSGTSGAFRVSASGFANQVLINDGQLTRQGATFVPSVDDSYDLGASSLKWDDVYATNGTIQTSDAKEKENIISSDLSLDFIKKLNPVCYSFIGKTRTHYGLIAQDVESLLSTIGKESTDFAGFIKSPLTDDDGNETGEFKYGLRYTEFISPMIKAIQEQQTLIEFQQSQIDALTARIEALETT